jgi:peptide/nickel transport system permease protein
MSLYLLQRLVRTLVVLMVLSLVVFVLLQLSGDPAAVMAPPNATDEDLENIRRSLGLDAPPYQQYLWFLRDLVTGNFGESWQYRQPALGLVLARFPATLQLVGVALAIGLVVGVPVGILSAARQGRLADFISTSATLAARAMPSFWLGLMLIVIFGVKLEWLPTFGIGGWQHLILPAITLSSAFIADIVLLTRSGVLEVMGEDYIRTARAKGMGEFVVYLRHAFPNAALPIVSAVGVICSHLVGGAVVTETVFAWPGVGSMAVQAVTARDFPLVQASVIVVALGVALVNLLTDLSYGLLDPHVRHAGRTA